MSRHVRSLLLASIVALSAVTTAVAADDEVFTVSTLSRARDQAGEDRLALVFITDEDDPDASFMERQAWGHPEVRDWVTRHAVAVRATARSGHGTALRTTYGIERIPAVLAFRGETLVRLHEGGLDARQLLAWLEVARSGDVALGDLVLESSAPTPSEAIPLEERLTASLDAETPAQAAVMLLALWDETLDTELQDRRRIRVCEALEHRVAADPTARERVAEAREAAWRRHRKRKSLSDLLDWFALNHLLGEDEATREWMRGAVHAPHGREWVAKVLSHPQDPILPMIVETRSWAVLGASVANPIALVDARWESYRTTRISHTGVESSVERERHLRELGAIVAGLLADGREREARAAADHIVEVDRKAAPTVVEVCLEANQPRRWMRGMLDPTRKDQVSLAMRLTKALQGI